MVWLQLTANTGPAECCLGVRHAFDALCKEAAHAGVDVSVIEQVDGPLPGTLRSVLLALGDNAGALAARWCGSLLWVCDSPYRSGHRRKNWFLHGAAFAPPALASGIGEIRYEATRASGPGGQHVNKTDSAIRATHLATGLSVKVQTERSQHANKRIAGQLLAAKLAALAEAQADQGKSSRRLQHWHAERGNAVRVFVGPAFIERHG